MRRLFKVVKVKSVKICPILIHSPLLVLVYIPTRKMRWALVVFCPRCRKKYYKNECPLDVVDVCGICADNHPTDKCWFLSPLKAILRGEGSEGPMEPQFYMNQKRSGPSRAFQQSYNQPYFPPFGTQFMQYEWVPIG